MRNCRRSASSASCSASRAANCARRWPCSKSNGELWRHVGKGTFVGHPPGRGNYRSVADIAAASNPREVMHARLLIEPLLAREAALNATAADIAEMRQCLKASREADHLAAI